MKELTNDVLRFAVMGIIMNYLTVIPPAASGTTGK